MASSTQSQGCHECRSKTKQTFSCIQCNNLAFCDDCWSEWILHKPGAVGYDGRPHEKSDPNIVRILRQILEPTRSESDVDNEHQADEDTTWFGVGRDASNQPVLQDYGRFATLLSEGQTQEAGERYPSLVSFIGQTGAGKSTLIKMLIERLEASAHDHTHKFPSPVTSTNNDLLPTTGDVHLYADPYTYRSKSPILYADCEGLDGGEAIPRGVRHRSNQNPISDITASLGANTLAGRSPRSSSRTSDFIERRSRRARNNRHSTQRDIAWAVTPETKKREYAVKKLYPRLLYTFSDVVVFVLRNPRAFESTVLEKLLEWGASSISKSLNQPALPHAIIVLNATENVDDSEWDNEKATQHLLDGIRGAIFREPRFEDQARFWRENGKKIETTKDLLECYYASITTIRVPSRGRYMLMDQQVEKLFTVVRKRSEASLLAKKRSRMLATAEKLQVYLQAAYDHFSRDLDTPFDFIKEALKHNPIPRDFGGNILNLAISIQKNAVQTTAENPARIFDQMAPMIASCIMLDSVRQNLMGSTVQLLNDAYVEYCKFAIDQFIHLYAPCGYKNPRYGSCCNVRSGHDPKGHQNRDGRIIGAGGYQCPFDPDEYFDSWVEQIKNELQHLQSQFSNLTHTLRERSDQEIAAELHLNCLNDFYRVLGDSSRHVSYSTCFSCLRELPEHALPCGHVLCLPCGKSYGRAGASKQSIVMSRCPLHQREMLWDPPWNVFVKPPYAGVRILCLDGGGVRGIVELQVLKAIEQCLGGKLQLQLFFDLIVGTSTGGIIALGLGVKNWSVEQCTRKFKELCPKAFTPRELNGIPVLGKLVMMSHNSKYKTRPFESALKEAFEEWPLFGGQNDLGEMFTKVAVTSTTAIQQHAVVLANYNRPEVLSQDSSRYEFLRAQGPAKEFKIWEAARATSAAPPFFKNFFKEDTKSSYLDGALYHNCPVWVAHDERRRIWHDVADAMPDILLSIGTGTNSLDGENGLPRRSTKSYQEEEDLSNAKAKLKSSKSFFPMDLWKTVMDRLGSLMRCNEIWNSFLTETSMSRHGRQGAHRRLIRIDPDLRGKVPELDDVDEMRHLEKATNQYLRQIPPTARIREIAHRLITSTFFFEKDKTSIRSVSKGGFECSGAIFCRFANGSDEMKALGEFLRNCLRNDFSPYFIIQEEDAKNVDVIKVPVGENLITDMCLRGSFKLSRIHVFVSKELATTIISLFLSEDSYPYSANSFLPISGFPRELVTEDAKNHASPPRIRVERHSTDFRNLTGTSRFKSFRDRVEASKSETPSPTLVDSPTSLKSPAKKSQSSKDLRSVFKQGADHTEKTEKTERSERPERPEDVGRWAKLRAEQDLKREDFVAELEG